MVLSLVNQDKIRHYVEYLATIRQKPPSHRSKKDLRCPEYHFIRYKGIECGIAKCLDVNTMYIGFVRIPSRNIEEFVWPSRHRELPFRVGIDFEWIDDETGDTIKGFHSKHLYFASSLQGIGFVTNDTIAVELFHFIDVCTQRIEHLQQ